MTTAPSADEAALAAAGPGEDHAALFAQLVTGHAQMALMFLGKLPNPQTGKAEEPNPEAAQVFIGQLEMLEAKTKGNLTTEEARLLGQMLGMTRMSFVDAIDTQLGEGKNPAATPSPPPEIPTTEAPEGEDKVKFTKKYS